MVAEVTPDYSSQWAAITAVANTTGASTTNSSAIHTIPGLWI